MITVVLDPDRRELSRTVKAIRSVFGQGGEVIMFSDPLIASYYIEENAVDVLFTQVSMLKMSGFEIKEKLLHIQPGAKIFYMADNDDYAVAAMHDRVNGYLVKPVTAEAIRRSTIDLKLVI